MSCEVEVGTIREVHKRLLGEGYNVTEHALRKWIKAGKLSAVYSGRKALISYSKVLSLLTA